MSVVAAFVLCCCSKNFIEDIKPADGTISSALIFTSREGVENALTGIYEIIRDYIPPAGKQNMHGWKSDQLNFDIRTNELIADPANWWNYENNWSDNAYGGNANSVRNLQIWSLNYKVINNANAIIQKTVAIPESQAVRDSLVGEARSLRAWAYFNLVRIYQFGYARDTMAPGVPLYTLPSDGASEGNPRASLRAVYQLIVSDLEAAIATLGPNRSGKYRINRNVAQGILAQVYAEMALANPALWSKAYSNAAAAVAGFPLMDAAGYNDGFNSVSNPEWIWGLPFNAAQSQSYAGFFGYLEPTAITGVPGRYHDLYINTSFISLFSPTDMRSQFLPAPNQDPSSPWKKWVTLKFRDNRSQSGDYILMRSAEMILIQAEALTWEGLLQPAIDRLFMLQHRRDPYALPSGARDAYTLIGEILLERRKELYAETGAAYFDLKRYQLPLIRDGNQWSLLQIPATDNHWRWQIPQSEMDTNKSLSAADQNPL